MGVLGKGRSSATGLLHVARQAAAAGLVFGIELYLRWVASEDNVADGPSRALDIGAAEATKEEQKWRHTPKAARSMLARPYPTASTTGPTTSTRWMGLLGLARVTDTAPTS
eukprot:7952762-Pyramimonas_sp.AAC.1